MGGYTLDGHLFVDLETTGLDRIGSLEAALEAGGPPAGFGMDVITGDI